MASNGFTEEDFVAVTVNGLMKEKSAAEARKKWQGIQSRVAAGCQRILRDPFTRQNVVVGVQFTHQHQRAANSKCINQGSVGENDDRILHNIK